MSEFKYDFGGSEVIENADFFTSNIMGIARKKYPCLECSGEDGTGTVNVDCRDCGGTGEVVFIDDKQVSGGA